LILLVFWAYGKLLRKNRLMKCDKKLPLRRISVIIKTNYQALNFHICGISSAGSPPAGGSQAEERSSLRE
jgi:hypothetical protein